MCATRRASRCQRSANGAASPVGVGAAASEDRIAVLVIVRAPGELGAVLAVALGGLAARTALVELGAALAVVLVELGAVVGLGGEALAVVLASGRGRRRKPENSERAASASGRIKRWASGRSARHARRARSSKDPRAARTTVPIDMGTTRAARGGGEGGGGRGEAGSSIGPCQSGRVRRGVQWWCSTKPRGLRRKSDPKSSRKSAEQEACSSRRPVLRWRSHRFRAGLAPQDRCAKYLQDLGAKAVLVVALVPVRLAPPGQR